MYKKNSSCMKIEIHKNRDKTLENLLADKTIKRTVLLSLFKSLNMYFLIENIHAPEDNFHKRITNIRWKGKRKKSIQGMVKLTKFASS